MAEEEERPILNVMVHIHSCFWAWLGMWQGSRPCPDLLVLGGNQEARSGPGPTGREKVREGRAMGNS